jgi:TPR repeat protein
MKTIIDDPRWEEAGKLYEGQKWADALSLFKALADDGVTAAYVAIARIYEYGYNGKYGYDRGVKQDHVEAFKWHLKAYEAGYGAGAVGLARLLVTGEGVERDYEKAFLYLIQVKRNHIVEVYRDLGMMYNTGKGVTQDHNKAKRMYLCAIAKGDKTAYTPVGVLLTKSGHKAKGYWLIFYGLFQCILLVFRGAWEAGQSNQRHDRPEKMAGQA